MATPAGRSGCEPKTECPHKTLRNDKRNKKKGKTKDERESQQENTVRLTSKGQHLSERTRWNVEIQGGVLLLTKDMLLKDSANNLQTDSFQLLSDLERRGNSKVNVDRERSTVGGVRLNTREFE